MTVATVCEDLPLTISFICFFEAPLGSLISNHVSCQVGIMLGGLLASTGLILSSFATSLEHLYLSLGVLTGRRHSAPLFLPGKHGNIKNDGPFLSRGVVSSPCHIATALVNRDTQTCSLHCKRETLAAPVRASALSESHTAQTQHAAEATL